MWVQVDLKERLYYIDTLRAFLMSYGIILHAHPLMENEFARFIGQTSNIFRMETFFIVSGFFTAIIFTRALTQASFGKRLYSLLVPFAIFVIFFNPLANIVLYHLSGIDVTLSEYLLHGPPALPDDSKFGISWHLHLWFLPVLAIFTCLYVPVKALVRSPIVVKLLQKLIAPETRPSLSFALLACAVALSSVFLRSVYFLSVEQYTSGTPLNHILVSSVQYLPFFALGTALFFYRPLFDLFHKFYYVQFAIAVAIFCLLKANLNEIEFHVGETGGELILRTAKAFCSVYSANLLFKVFSTLFRSPGKVSRFLADASYTVYLVHMYLIIGFLYFFYKPGVEQPLIYVTAIVTTYVACLALHAGVISRFKITRSLVNGKLELTKPKT